jgi:hypothetical protein
MVGDQDADAAVCEVPGDALDVVHRQRVDAGEGLIEQDEGRVRRQRSRDLDAAPLAAREAHAQVVAQVRHVQLLQQALERLLAARIVEVVARLENRLHVVDDRQLAEDRWFLRQVTEAPARARVHGQRGDVLAVELDATAVAGNEADDHVERRRLSGAVRAEEADHFAARDGEREGGDDLALAIALLEPRGRELAHGCGFGFSGARSPG